VSDGEERGPARALPPAISWPGGARIARVSIAPRQDRGTSAECGEAACFEFSKPSDGLRHNGTLVGGVAPVLAAGRASMARRLQQPNPVGKCRRRPFTPQVTSLRELPNGTETAMGPPITCLPLRSVKNSTLGVLPHDHRYAPRGNHAIRGEPRQPSTSSLKLIRRCRKSKVNGSP